MRPLLHLWRCSPAGVAVFPAGVEPPQPPRQIEPWSQSKRHGAGTVTARAEEESRDKDVVTHGRRYATYVCPTSPSDNSVRQMSAPRRHSRTAIRPSRPYINSVKQLPCLLSFTDLTKVFFDERSPRRSHTFNCSQQLSSHTVPSVHVRWHVLSYNHMINRHGHDCAEQTNKLISR